MPVEQAGGGGRVFISYGRQDAGEFADRLAKSLEQRGFEVFIDRWQIGAAHAWDVVIEQGIRDADAVTVVITQHAVRPGSVCRDEIAFAHRHDKRIIPVLGEPGVPPPLLLCRLQWVDFTGDFDAAVEALVAALRGDHSGLREPRFASVGGVRPFDFGPEVARHSAGFVGREWLNPILDEWLLSDRRRVFAIVAEPGVGKSAIAAWLARTRTEQVVAFHFCTYRNTRTLDPYEFVGSLVGQLASALPGYADALTDREPERRRDSASNAFRELVIEPCRSLAAPDGPRLMIVDALDEAVARPGETVLTVLVNHAGDLPEWLRIVTTTRPDEPVLRRIRHLGVFELRADRPENLQDVETYLAGRLNDPATIARLQELAEGNFLYAQLAVEAIEDGILGPHALGGLAPGLAAFYTRDFEARFPSPEDYRRDYAPLLRPLAAARAPLPRALLQHAAGLGAEDLRDRLAALRLYLRLEGDEPAYALFHKSLADWLNDADAAGPYWLDPAAGEQALAEACRAAPRDGYPLRHAASHLLAAERWDELAELLTDLAYLEARVTAGQAFELATDLQAAWQAMPAGHPWRWNLRLLDQAYRRRLHFIDRCREDYPQALFQSLWNEAWWYDSEEAARHYEPPAGGWGPAGPPWERGEPKLSTLLERWRAERARAGWCWLRCRRPPAVPLGGAELARLTGHEGQVWSVVWSPDGSRIASGSSDRTVRVWAPATSAEPSRLDHPGQVWSVAWSPDGSCIASGSDDCTVRVWDATTGTELDCLTGHEAWVYSVAWSPDGSCIASGSSDHTVRVWHLASRAELACLTGHEKAVVLDVAWSPDGSQLASGSSDGAVRVWHLASRAELACLTGHNDKVNSVAWSPDGSRIASGSDDNTVRVWDPANRAELARCSGHERHVRSVAWSLDGSRIASGSSDRTVRVWDPANRAELARFTGHEDPAYSVAWSPDGARLASAAGNTVRVWAAVSGAELPRLTEHERQVLRVVWSLDGSRLASGSADGTVRVWDATTGTELACLTRHNAPVWSVAWSPDGARIASGSSDRTVRVWDATTGTELACLTGHKAPVWSVAWSPDGSRLESESWDRTMRVWDAASGACLDTLGGYPLETVLGHLAHRPESAAGEWDNSELTVRSVPDGALLARIDLVGAREVCESPAGRVWAWAAGPHVQIVSLESEPSP